MSASPKAPADDLRARMAEELRLARVPTGASRLLAERATRVIHEARMLRRHRPAW